MNAAKKFIKKSAKAPKNTLKFAFIFILLCCIYIVSILPTFLLVSLLYLLFRKISLRHIKEQLGFLSFQQGKFRHNHSPSSKDFFWLHVSSFGEWSSARPLAKLFKEKTKMNLFLSYFNEEMQSRVQSDPLVDEKAFLPIENPIAFLFLVKKLRIRCVFLMEIEIWPLLIFFLHSRGIPIYLLSAILWKKELKAYTRAAWLFRPVFRRVTRLYASSQETKDAFIKLGARKEAISLSPSLKFSVEAESSSTKGKNSAGKKAALPKSHPLGPLLRQLESSAKPSLLLASIHFKEFALLFESLEEYLRSEEIQVIIAPRQIQDGALFIKFLSQQNIAFALRQKTSHTIHTKVFAKCGTILIISLGELRYIYKALASNKASNKKRGKNPLSNQRKKSLVLIGGSFINKGGHNAFEAIRMGLPVIIGPYHYSQKAVLQIAAKSITISHAKHLKADIQNVFRNPAMPPLAASVIKKLENAAKLFLPKLIKDLKKDAVL